MVIYKNKEDILKINDYDLDEDIYKKIFLNLDKEIIPISGIHFIKKDKQIEYTTILQDIKIVDILSNLNNYLDINSGMYSKFIKELNKKYPKLKLEELYKIVNHIISLNIPFVNIDKKDLENFINDIKKQKKNILENFLKKEKDIDLIKNIIDYKDGLPDYNVVSCNIHFTVSDEPLDIYNIINKYKLSKNVPFMMAIKEYSVDPIIKYYNKTNEIDYKNWIYTKNLNNEQVLKKPKGLSIKILFKTDNTYKNLTISRSTKNIYIKIGLSNSCGNYKYKDLFVISRDLDFFFKELKTFIPNIKDPKKIDYIISNFSTNINLKTPIDLKKLNVFLRDSNFVVNLLENNIKIYDEVTGFLYNIKSDGIDNKLTINNLKNEYDIQKSYTMILDILLNLNKNVDIIIKNKIKKEKLKIHGTKNKKLKQLGIPVNSTECQKIRQISVLTDELPVNLKYTIDYKDTKLYCDNDKFPYPGFTNTNIPCCFKKDQREKEAFKRNTKKDINEIVSDIKIINSHLITTNKVLDINRIGILESGLNTFFNENYFKIGVSQNNSFINSINFLMKTVLPNLDVSEQLFKTLKTSDSSEYIPDLIQIDEFRKKLIYNNGNYLLQDFFQKKLGIGIITLSFQNEKIKIEYSDIYWKLNDYKKYIIIYKHNTLNSYEPIVMKNDNNLQRTFSFEDQLISNLYLTYKNDNISKLLPMINDLYSVKELLNINVIIKSQYVNDFNKTEYIDTGKGILPVSSTNPSAGIKQITKLDNFYDSKEQFDYLKDMSKKKSGYTPIAQYIKDEECLAIATLSGISVPVKKDSNILNLKKIMFDIPFEISNIIYKNNQVFDTNSEYIQKVKYYKELYNRCVYTISSIINKNLEIKEKINVIINEKIDISSKTKNIKTVLSNILNNYILTVKDYRVKDINIPLVRNLCHELSLSDFETDPFCKKKEMKYFLVIPEEQYEVILIKLSNDIISDPKIMNGDIRLKFLTQNFLKRKDEVLLTNKKEIEDKF